MIEHLYNTKPLDPKNYRAKVGCINCEGIELIDILKGKPIDIWCNEKKVKCSACECLETLISYNAYKAQKAMMNQIMQMAKQEADGDAKNLGHYG